MLCKPLSKSISTWAVAKMKVRGSILKRYNSNDVMHCMNADLWENEIFPMKTLEELKVKGREDLGRLLGLKGTKRPYHDNDEYPHQEGPPRKKRNNNSYWNNNNNNNRNNTNNNHFKNNNNNRPMNSNNNKGNSQKNVSNGSNPKPYAKNQGQKFLRQKGNKWNSNKNTK